MRIQCDACEGAAATVVCCADEAALCAHCDVEIHAANKLASKHQRLPLGDGSAAPHASLPRCDVCQEKAAFIFCVEDRALFCRDCDEPIHVPGTLSGNHQRYLATGIRVGFSSVCGAGAGADGLPPPPKGRSKPAAAAGAGAAKTTPVSKAAQPQEKDSPLGFKELEWFADIDLFHGHTPAKATTAEVPELFATPQPASNAGFCKSNGARQSKKPRVELPDDEEDYFIVPDLG
ncbi:B-box zinc finger protein 24 [Dichanthelium oligosanthes]|uniref:B-box zinc finger protein 24 n=1 Tax=Dichanthelium oligosanthes TaxID=888268 RepID=A0A1E5VJ92_9POAL|nr:B-box zinc finger protein 24 [Dichanthelium oligosanthes]